MPNLTVRADESLLDDLDADADEQGVSRAEHVRQILRSRHESDERVAALESEIGALETECERLRNQNRMIVAQREEHSDLVRAVERERTLEERRARAGLGTKLKWALFGMKED